MKERDLYTLYPVDEWREDEGDVLWHHLDEYGGLCEAPIVADEETRHHGAPWPDYYSHWSRLPWLPQYPIRALMIAPAGSLICDWDAGDAT